MGTMPIRERTAMRALADSGLIAAVVFAASYVGIAFLVHDTGVALIWIANAFAVYFILSRPPEEALRVIGTAVAARFFAGLAAGDTLLSATAFSLCNLFEILTLALPLRALNLPHEFTKPRSLLWFYALAVGPAPVAAAVPAALFIHFFRGSDFIPTLLNWYAADALGLTVVVPILFTVKRDAFLRMFRADQLAKTLMFMSTVAAAIVVNRLAQGYPLAFLVFPAVLFLTFQRSFEGGAIGIVVVTAYLITPLLLGQPIAGLRDHTLREQVLIIEVFIAVIGFSVVLVGAALEERRKLEENLSAATRRAQSAREEALVAKDAAENASRMKSMFLATMSHELRTPLNAIIGFSQMMETETFGPLGDAHYHEYTGLIQKAGRHLLELINDILDMSKIEAGKFELHREQIECSAIVEECMDLMRERADHAGIALEQDVPPGISRFEADPRAVKQIMLNLLSNAIKFTPSSGRVTVRAAQRDGMLMLSVADTGVGIPADQLYRLGNPFVQLRNNAGATHEGTGLGLALVRSLAEMHGGEFKIESVEGHGTTVTVSLPVAQRIVLAA